MALPPRPYWKGHMRLSLVTFAVVLYPAISSAGRITFHQLQRGTGARIREQKVVPGSGEVAKEDIVKGYEVEKGRFVVIEDQDLEAIKLETRKTIELFQFFDAAEIDPVYFDKPYYVVPDGAVATEAYGVVRTALARSGRAGLGRVVLSGHERLVAVLPRDRGFALFTLHAADMVRKPGLLFADLPEAVADEDEVAVAEQLIARKTAPLDPARFVDRYQEELRRIIQRKLAGQAPVVAEMAEPGNVVDLMEALKRSLAQDSEPPPARNRARRKA